MTYNTFASIFGIMASLILIPVSAKSQPSNGSKIISGNNIRIDATPPAFSHGGNVSLYIRHNDNSDDYGYEIFDDEFNLLKKFVPSKKDRVITIHERYREEILTCSVVWKDSTAICGRMENESESDFYQNAMSIIRPYIDESRTVRKEHNGKKIEIYYPKDSPMYFLYEAYGIQYPRNYWVIDYGLGVAFEYHVEYSEGMYPRGEWKDSIWVNTLKPEDASIGIINYNSYQGTREDDGDYLTQTLFNDDEDFEVLIPIYQYGTRKEETDWDGDGEIDWEYSCEGDIVFAGYQAIKENGDVVCTFEFGDGFNANTSWYYEPDYDLAVISINDKIYLAVTGYINTEEGSKNSLIVYRIDNSTSNVRMVRSEENVSAISKQYDLQGRSAPKAQKGILIQKETNGRFAKYLKK